MRWISTTQSRSEIPFRRATYKGDATDLGTGARLFAITITMVLLVMVYRGNTINNNEARTSTKAPVKSKKNKGKSNTVMGRNKCFAAITGSDLGGRDNVGGGSDDFGRRNGIRRRRRYRGGGSALLGRRHNVARRRRGSCLGGRNDIGGRRRGRDDNRWRSHIRRRRRRGRLGRRYNI